MLANLIGTHINFYFHLARSLDKDFFHATFTMETSVLLCPSYRDYEMGYKIWTRFEKFRFFNKRSVFDVPFFTTVRNHIVSLQRHYLRQIYTPLLLLDLVGNVKKKNGEGRRFENLFIRIE